MLQKLAVNRRGNSGESFFSVASAAVASLAVDLPPGEEIFDLAGPQPLSYPWWQLIGQTLAVVVAFWLLWLFYGWVTAPVPRLRRHVVQTPQKQALRAIERLKISPVWQENRIKEVCEAIACILKVFAREKHAIGFGAPSTSDELLESLGGAGVSQNVFNRISLLLSECDRVKFMGAAAPGIAPEELLTTLTELVMMEGWKK